MLKKGKIYCIKDYLHVSGLLSDDCYFYEGHIYELFDNSKNDNYLTLSIFDDDNNRLNFHHESPLFLYDLPEYFISLSESRKLKLERLVDVKY